MTDTPTVLTPLVDIGRLILRIDRLAQDMEMIDSTDESARALAELINNLTVAWFFPHRVK